MLWGSTLDTIAREAEGKQKAAAARKTTSGTRGRQRDMSAQGLEYVCVRARLCVCMCFFFF